MDILHHDTVEPTLHTNQDFLRQGGGWAYFEQAYNRHPIIMVVGVKPGISYIMTQLNLYRRQTKASWGQVATWGFEPVTKGPQTTCE